MVPNPSPEPAPSGSEGLELLEEELHRLTQEYAMLRAELEERFHRVREIEERFLALRPEADRSVQRELKRRMVLSRPWREELDMAYQSLLATTHRIGEATRRIHDLQLRIAHLASSPASRPLPPPPPPG